MCAAGTGAKDTIECTEGYYCPEQTSLELQFKYQCEAGFFCRKSTGESTKTRDNCPQTYYCPPGTKMY